MKASTIIKQAEAWIGCKASNGTHKKIIDTYNAHKPLARNYKVKYTDAWCATFVSAVFIKCGAANMIPLECGCQEMINLMKKKGIWIENENRTPAAGEIIFYDWQDSGSGDNQGWSDHVGIVQKVTGSTIYVIEGNYNNEVKVRQLTVNGKYIRGYGVPKYEAEAATVNKPVITPVTNIDYAASFDKGLAGTYTTTANLNMRVGAGTNKAKITVIPKGGQVKCYGYYTAVNGVKWYLVTYKEYKGFVSSRYCKK